MTPRPAGELLGMAEFWRFYYGGEDHELDESVIASFSESENFEVQFRLDVGSQAIVVEVVLDLWMINLGLETRGKTAELGWIDHARWHPGALRWEEVETMLLHWRSGETELAYAPQHALLLLAPFIGTGAAESRELDRRREATMAAFRSLQLFDEAEVAKLGNTYPPGPPEPDYEWSPHPELGWVFDGEYPCYSIRNPAHVDGAEGMFPFRDFATLRRRLALDDVGPSD